MTKDERRAVQEEARKDNCHSCSTLLTRIESAASDLATLVGASHFYGIDSGGQKDSQIEGFRKVSFS